MDDLDSDRDLTYGEKKLIREAQERSRKLKEIKANMSDDERRQIEKDVSSALSSNQLAAEENRERQSEEEDGASKEEVEFKLKKQGYD